MYWALTCLWCRRNKVCYVDRCLCFLFHGLNASNLFMLRAYANCRTCFISWPVHLAASSTCRARSASDCVCRTPGYVRCVVLFCCIILVVLMNAKYCTLVKYTLNIWSRYDPVLKFRFPKVRNACGVLQCPSCGSWSASRASPKDRNGTAIAHCAWSACALGETEMTGNESKYRQHQINQNEVMK